MADTLLEWGYRDLWGQIDWSFIHMKSHYDAIQSMGVQYEGMPADDIVEFSTESESRPGLRHHQLIQMVDLEKELQNPQNRNIGDAVRAAMSGDLLVHCDCEAHLFYYQWILLNKDAALMPIAQGNPKTKYDGGDVRPHPPNIKNPGRRGSVCKHLGNVLKVFPFWWSTIAGELQKRGFGPSASTVEVPAEPSRGGEQPSRPSVARTPGTQQKVKQPRPVPQPEEPEEPTFPELVTQAVAPEQPFQQRPKTKRKPVTKKKKTKKRKPRQPRPGQERPTFPGIGEIGDSFKSMVDKLLEKVG